MDGKERVRGQEMTAVTMCVVMARGRGVLSRSTDAFDGSRKVSPRSKTGRHHGGGCRQGDRLSGRTSWGSILNASVSHRRTRWKKAEGRRTVQSCEPGDISLWFFMLLILVNIYVLKWNRFLQKIEDNEIHSRSNEEQYFQLPGKQLISIIS